MRTEVPAAGGVQLSALISEPAAEPTIVGFQPDRAVVLFVNAVGMPIDLLEPLVPAFAAAGLQLATWELRGSPGPGDAAGTTLADHVRDGLAVLDHLGVSEVHLAGWCTGASIGALLVDALGPRARSFSSIDGAYLFDGRPAARQGNAVFEMCARIAADPAQGAYFHELIRPRGTEAAVLGLTGRPDLLEAVTLPYRRQIEGLVRYAFGIRAANDYETPAVIARLAAAGVPVLFVARRDDQVVSFRNSVRAAEQVPGSVLRIADRGGHYAFFTEESAAREIADFAAAAGRDPVAVPAGPDLFGDRVRADRPVPLEEERR